MNAETRKAAGRIASILNIPKQTDTYPELEEMCANSELREALIRITSWIRAFELPTWTDDFLNHHGDASLRWYIAAEKALAATV